MKNYLIAVIICFILPSFMYSQEDDRNGQRNRIEQLEKLKLIETLNLSEDVSVRFFSRRNKNQKEIEAIEDKTKELFDKLDESLNSKSKDSELEQKKIINEILNNRELIEQKRKQFILSLNDILATEQIAEYVLFEKKFRDELRKLIFDRRKPPNPRY